MPTSSFSAAPRASGRVALPNRQERPRSLAAPAALVALALVSGCVTTTYGTAKVADDTAVSQIKEGVSRKEDVRALMGEPSNVSFRADSAEEWSYDYFNQEVGAGVMIPGNWGSVESEWYTLKILFNPNGVVKAVARSQDSTGRGM